MIVDIPDSAIEWLLHGERGASSEAIFKHLTGIPIDGYSLWAPVDGSDLRRCRLLLAAVPEFAARFDEMKTATSQWALLVNHWDELCAIQDEGGSVMDRIHSLLFRTANP